MRNQAPAPSFYHLALTGFPLGHSRSPIIHATALRLSGLTGDYLLRPIPPENTPSGLGNLVDEIRAGTLHGLNVTIPYKQAILQHCDELTPAAQAIGAANLIYLENGKIIADNSDARGFIAALDPYQKRWAEHERTALVLGAGGSARAVIYALATAGWKIYVAARRLEQADALATELAHGTIREAITTILFPDSLSGSTAFNLLVNTTPIGMYPKSEANPWPEETPLPRAALVYDLVYNPQETSLLRQARTAGLPTIGGLQMLVEQAAVAFERWTGVTAPRKAMFDSLQNTLT